MKKSPLKLLAAGSILFFIGIFFFLKRVYGADFCHIIIPLMLIITGGFLLYFAVLCKKGVRYFISGLFFSLIGIFFIFQKMILADTAVSMIWPVFMFIFGIFLVIYALPRKKPKRITILVPAAAMCVLSVIFMPFSFKLITKSLFRFAFEWWPVLCLSAGIILITIYLILFYNCSKNCSKGREN